jgi:peptide chain release factor 1
MKISMQNKLSTLSNRIEELNGELSKEDATKDMERFKKISKEHSDILPVVDIYKDYLKFDKDISDAREMLSDPEMKNFAQAEIDNGKMELEKIEKELQKLLLPKDLNDDKNIFLEIRAGA